MTLANGNDPQRRQHPQRGAAISSDAVDILQEISLGLWKKCDSFEPGTNFIAWACQIARLQAMKQYQQNKQGPKLFDSVALDLLAMDAEEAVGRSEVKLEILEDCVSKLSVKDQTLIRCCYEPNSSVKLLAEYIGRSTNSVSKSLGRIRRLDLECAKRHLPVEWSRQSHG